MSMSYLITQIQCGGLRVSAALTLLVQECESKACSEVGETGESFRELRDVLEACQGDVERLEEELDNLI